MPVLRACVKCGKPSPGSYCPEHKPKPWATSRRKERMAVSSGVESARRKRILKRYLYACHYCGHKGADQVDHVVPLGEGGADDETNLAPIHAEPCHREKTAQEAQRARQRASAGGGEPRLATDAKAAGVVDGARRSRPGGIDA
jgi:5-methylcytosine-specific restriction endonuclease McrA